MHSFSYRHKSYAVPLMLFQRSTQELKQSFGHNNRHMCLCSTHTLKKSTHEPPVVSTISRPSETNTLTPDLG